MKTLKITLALVAIATLTISGVKSDNDIVDNESTIKTYSPKDFLAVDKKKLKLETQA
ncbi:hypothetical protein [uncultured Winogradskyella sp.]|uniref:hypothetical protein n=1 Tax=uncultured Winogradskyella sp. TaxID=395353 RepID=UPI00260BA5B4|nr:hypothetical protein [uncultured Winogradskyella sp.]